VSGSISASSSVSLPAVCIHALDIVNAKGSYLPVVQNTSCGVGVAHKRSRPVCGDMLRLSILANAKLLHRAPNGTAKVDRHAAALSAVVAAGGVSSMCHAVMSS